MTASPDPAEMLEATPDETDRETEDPEEISKDDLFHVLQNDRRRRVLAYLTYHSGDGPFEMRTIAEQVAAWEHDKTVQQLMSDERQRVYIALYQSHLPKLDEVGLISYRQNRGIVETKPLIETASRYVDYPDDESEAEPSEIDEQSPDTTAKNQISQQQAFASVTALSLLLTVGVWLQSIPTSFVSGVQAAFIVTALFALTTIVTGWIQAKVD